MRTHFFGIFLLCAPLHLGAQQTSDLVSHSEFRVCADPANWPQSDDKLEGYENRIAEIFATALDRKLSYEWYPMSTGFVRNTLTAGKCDVIIGFSAGEELVLNTNPYYISTYLLITKKSGALAKVERLNDPALSDARIGVVAGTAPSSHMSKLGLIAKAAPYQLFVDSRYDNPSKRMLDDLEKGVVDAAIIWGPIGGPMVKTDHPDLNATPLLHEEGKPELFARITMGVRHGDSEWKRVLNSQIRRHQSEIDMILKEAGVPLLENFGKEIKVIP